MPKNLIFVSFSVLFNRIGSKFSLEISEFCVKLKLKFFSSSKVSNNELDFFSNFCFFISLVYQQKILDETQNFTSFSLEMPEATLDLSNNYEDSNESFEFWTVVKRRLLFSRSDWVWLSELHSICLAFKTISSHKFVWIFPSVAGIDISALLCIHFCWISDRNCLLWHWLWG